MTDAPRRPGPWDPKPGAGPAPQTPTPPWRKSEADRGQSLPWAVISTLLMAGLIWWLTGSWVIVVALIFGLLVHEYGHVLAMNRLGMGPAKIYIIPFLGGLAKAQRNPESEWHGVLVSLAGPAFGLLAAAPFFGLWQITGQSAWLDGVFAIAMINLINLAPAPPLDGSKALGPVLARVHPTLEWAALLATGVAVVWWGVSNGSFLFAAFLGIALIGHLRRDKWRPYGRPLTWGEAGMSTMLFLAVAAACAAVAVGAILPMSDAGLMGGMGQAGRALGVVE